MAHKRLTQEQINHMKQMVQNSVAPEDIAKHFGIAISSVHNYKARFKADGMKFPSVRGKRPTGDLGLKPMADKINKPMVEKLNKPMAPPKEDGLVITVNGVMIQIDPDAKTVNIGKHNIEINF